MITFAKSYKTSDDRIFGTVIEAQTHELEIIFEDVNITATVGKSCAVDIANAIISKKELIVDILTTTPNSKPQARSLHGGTKKRPSKTVVTDAVTSVTSVANTPA